jgi:translation initiation factor 4A
MQESSIQVHKHVLSMFYVACGTEDAKLATLLDLLRAFETVAPLSTVICCSSRDSLDSVCTATYALPDTHFWVTHSDMSERDINATAQSFKSTCRPSTEANNADNNTTSPPSNQATNINKKPIYIYVTTDPCLKVLSKENTPLQPALLINYDPPAKKEIHLRRIGNTVGNRSTAAGRRLVIHFVVAGHIEAFRAVEEFAGDKPILEMPVHVADIFDDRGMHY